MEAVERKQQDLPRPYKCTHCDKAFHRLEHQSRHIRTHTREKPQACQSCPKRFSRSDELTRHKKIHTNRESKKRRLVQAAHDGRVQEGSMVIIPQLNENISRLAPASTVGSSIVSSPHSYAPYSAVASWNRNHSHRSLNPPSLSNYAISRSHSHHKDDHYSHQNTKRSRLDSLDSTSSSSPTFSYNPPPLTPDRTPLATPMDSPHLRTDGNDYNLPKIRNLPLQQTPALTPMEPQFHTNNQATSAPPQPRSVISDIIFRTDGIKRILPPPSAPGIVVVTGQQLVDDFMA